MKASCVLCVNRDDGFLAQTVQSVLDQNFKEFEFIIVANGDFSKLQPTLSQFNDPRIKVIKSDLEIIGYARNLGIDAAKGEYILNIDGDDICLPDRFSKQIEFMENNPQIAVASSWAFLIDEKNKKIGELRPTPIKNTRWLCVFTNPIINPSAIIRKTLWKKYKGYPCLQSSEDMAFWLKLGALGEKGIRIIPEFHIMYRLHNNQTYRRRLPYIEAAFYQVRLFLIGYGHRYLLGAIVYFFKGFIRGRS